jgi:hypothetical protein
MRISLKRGRVKKASLSMSKRVEGGEASAE